MIIGITGIRGFIGQEVARLARERDHEVIGFSRSAERGENHRPFSLFSVPDLSGIDAMVHLAGESILGLWTTEKRRRILESRVLGTRRVVEGMTASARGPKILVSSSAIGYYGDTGEHAVTENSPSGTGFLADVSRQWEAEAMKAESSSRTCVVRTGFVLGPDGGAMRMVAPVFRAGLGGNLGNGRQWMSCIHVRDVAGIFVHAVESETVGGPLNAVMPEPVRNSDFTKEAAAAAHRPAIFPAPGFAIRLALGDLSHVLLDSQRVVPERTLATGYPFQFPDVRSAMADTFR